MEAATLAEISPARASAALAGCEALDPRGMTSAADLEAMTRNGRCFELAGHQARAVYVLRTHNGVCWVDALKGCADGVDLVDLVDGLITTQAEGLDAIALQTRRAGLVKKLQRRGYRITGWVMRKEIQ